MAFVKERKKFAADGVFPAASFQKLRIFFTGEGTEGVALQGISEGGVNDFVIVLNRHHKAKFRDVILCTSTHEKLFPIFCDHRQAKDLCVFLFQQEFP